MSRPQNVYLIAKYFARPKYKRLSNVAGNMQSASDVQWDEQVNISKRLKPADIATAKIVLNITKQTVEVNGFRNNKSFMELFEYFYKSSPAEISRQLRLAGINLEQQYDDVSEDVPGEEEASEGPVPASATEPS